MNESELKLGNNAVSKTQADWNVDTIAEQIFSDLNGSFTLSTIQEVLKEVIPKYASARIQIYVPIFIRRDAVNQLKSMQAPYAAPDMARNAAAAKNGSQASSGPSQRRVDGDEQDKTTDTGLINWNPPARGALTETAG
jgi:hypothetical protein